MFFCVFGFFVCWGYHLIWSNDCWWPHIYVENSIRWIDLLCWIAACMSIFHSIFLSCRLFLVSNLHPNENGISMYSLALWLFGIFFRAQTYRQTFLRLIFINNNWRSHIYLREKEKKNQCRLLTMLPIACRYLKPV